MTVENGQLLVISKAVVAADVVARSPMLQSLHDAPGQVTDLPISHDAFLAWTHSMGPDVNMLTVSWDRCIATMEVCAA